jgi:hypothetical protein
MAFFLKGHSSKEELLCPEAQSPLRELGFALRREAETRHLDSDETHWHLGKEVPW